MSLLTTHDLFYLVGAICALWITGFFCWVLYETARLMRQANDVVREGRAQLTRFERSIVAIGEKLGNVSHYLGFIAEGGKQLLSFLHTREEKHASHTRREKGE